MDTMKLDITGIGENHAFLYYIYEGRIETQNNFLIYNLKTEKGIISLMLPNTISIDEISEKRKYVNIGIEYELTLDWDTEITELIVSVYLLPIENTRQKKKLLFKISLFDGVGLTKLMDIVRVALKSTIYGAGDFI